PPPNPVALDDVRRARTIGVDAPNPDALRVVVNALSRKFPPFSADDLLEAARRDGANDPTAYARLAMGMREHDARASELLRSALESKDVEVRANAANAILLLRWPDLGEAVRRALLMETDVGFANLLEVIARSYP